MLDSAEGTTCTVSAEPGSSVGELLACGRCRVLVTLERFGEEDYITLPPALPRISHRSWLPFSNEVYDTTSDAMLSLCMF